MNMNYSKREHKRAESVTSRRFYQSEAVDQKLISLIETAESSQPKNLRTKQSKHLPFWAWFIIAKINGVPLKPNEKPIFGTFLHMLTFACAFAYASSYTWYVVYDIVSPNTPRDIPGGTVSIFLVYCWCGFGFYCKTLISRLFFYQRFLKDVRMHSRTVFKINAAFLALILSSLFTAAKIYETMDTFLNDYACEQVELDPLVCYVLTFSSVSFTLFTLLWHTLISFVFMSVCRTHTIGLRCFIQELEHDAAVFQYHHSTIYKTIAANDTWPDTAFANCSDDEESVQFNRTQNPLHGEQYDSNVPPTNLEHSGEIGILMSPVIENLGDSDEYPSSDIKDICQPQQTIADRGSSASTTVSTLSSSEILHNFWRLNRRLRFTSSALQRWFASFIALVLLRCSTYLVHWLGHVATVCDVLQFLLPLILLVVLSSALAEVNFEGQRFTRSVYPTSERLKLFQYLYLNPLQMPIYGFGMTHGTIVTVVFAILVGFVTRIVITELTK